MTFVNAAVISACIAISYFIWNYCRRIFLDKEEIPSAKILTKLLRGTPDELLDLINLLARRYPSPFQLKMLSLRVIITHEPDQIKTILQSQHCLDKNILYKFSKPVLGMGLATASASVWTQSREIIVSSFNPIMLREFFDTFVEQSLILTDKLEKVALNGNKIAFREHIIGCAVDITCGAMMNIKLESNIRDEYIKRTMRFKNILTYRLYLTWVQNNFLYYDVIFNLTTLGREQQKIVKFKDSFIQEMMQHKLNKLHTIETETNSSHKMFLHILMDEFRKKNFTEKIIHDNVITLISMATDKISITLDFVVFMLANFPEIQEKVYKELTEIYGTETPTSAPVKYNDLQRMHYLDRVIKETLRLFPPIPVIGRKLTKPMKIGKYILPKKSNVIIPFMRMYRKEEYWPDPLKFDPDRFLPERIKDHHSYYYIPFSDGPRNCIGMRYAMMSMKVILATLVRTFVFKVDRSIQIDEIRLQMDISLSTIKPLEVTIEKRDP